MEDGSDHGTVQLLKGNILYKNAIDFTEKSLNTVFKVFSSRYNHENSNLHCISYFLYFIHNRQSALIMHFNGSDHAL